MPAVSTLERSNSLWTPYQAHALRVLVQSGPDGLCTAELRARMQQAPFDMGRFLERLERGGWIRRARLASDRRVVIARLTEAGREVAERSRRPAHLEGAPR